jgi:hypothetical protein
MGGGGGQKSQTTQNVPWELSGLYSGTGQRLSRGQESIWGDGGDSEFMNARVRDIAPRSAGQDFASQLTLRSANPSSYEPWARQAIAGAQGQAQRTVTGSGLATDPAIQAARTAFREGAAKNIVDQQSLSGRGRMNSVDNALANAEAQFMLPVIQEGLAREERGIDRQIGTYGNTANQLMNLGQAETARNLSAIQAGQQTGATERGIEQERLDAPFQDYLRRQNLAEQFLFGPMGQLPSTIGQTVKTSGGK